MRLIGSLYMFRISQKASAQSNGGQNLQKAESGHFVLRIVAVLIHEEFVNQNWHTCSSVVMFLKLPMVSVLWMFLGPQEKMSTN